MKLAVIPPLCYPYWYNEAHDNYKLILPEHWNNQQHFEATMLNHRRGGFTILDNGAAEGKPHDWEDLLKLARRCHVNEVVLPDVMGDAQGTMRAAKEVFDDTWHPTNHFGLMGVVQGTTVAECVEVIDFYSGMAGRQLQTIGLPRCLVATTDNPQIRLVLAEHIRLRAHHSVDIHLLGTVPEYIFELRDFGPNFRRLGVRGVDTSAPFVYTQASAYIGDGDTCRRQADYFVSRRDQFPQKLLDMNINTLVRWVHG